MDLLDNLPHPDQLVVGHLALAIPGEEVRVIVADHRGERIGYRFPQVLNLSVEEGETGRLIGQAFHGPVAREEEQYRSLLVFAIFYAAEIVLVRAHLFLQ